MPTYTLRPRLIGSSLYDFDEAHLVYASRLFNNSMLGDTCRRQVVWNGWLFPTPQCSEARQDVGDAVDGQQDRSKCDERHARQWVEEADLQTQMHDAVAESGPRLSPGSRS